MRFDDYVAAIPRTPKQTTNFLFDLNARLNRQISYLIRMEPGIQTPDETLKNASGSCRDTSWLLVQILRHLGLAARFASGYLIQLKPDVKSLDGPSGASQDFTDLHAWCEVFLPGAGWVGLRSHLGPFCRRRPYSLGLRRQSHPGRAHFRRRGKKRSPVRLRHVDHPRPGNPASRSPSPIAMNSGGISRPWAPESIRC